MHNVNTFSNVRYLKKKDPRRNLYRQQRKERGFDNSELWALDETIIRFALPRLKVFRDYTNSYPVDDTIKNFEDWQLTIDKMIYAMEKYIDDTWDTEAIEGIDLFLKYFRHLWN